MYVCLVAQSIRIHFYESLFIAQIDRQLYYLRSSDYLVGLATVAVQQMISCNMV